MDCNTDDITRVAKQVAETFKAALAQGRQAEGPSPTIAEVEKDIREMLRQIGAEALSVFSSTGQGTPAAELPCACGGTLPYPRRRPATVTSVFGKITYERAYYAGCAGGQGKAPVAARERYGLEPGALTSGLAALLAVGAGVEFAFDESRAWLQAFLLFEVAGNTVRSETQTSGALHTQREEALCPQSQDEDQLQARLRETPRLPARLYGSLEAAKVRIEPRPKAGKKPENTDAWRDMKVGCWYEAEPAPPTQRSVRQQEKFEREQAVFRAKNMRYYCDIQEAEAFGKLMWGTGCAAQADLVSDLVFVCDGAVWIWNLVEFYYPHAVHIVDCITPLTA